MDHIVGYIQELKQVLDQLPRDRIDQVITILHEARFHGRQVFIIGSGSNAPLAAKFVSDLSKITRQSSLPGFKVIGLADNLMSLSKFSEGDDQDEVMHVQLESLLTRGDVVIAISTNGNSKIIIRAIEIANRKGATTIGFCGGEGGRMAPLADVCIQVPSQNVEYIENSHQVVETLIARVLQDEAQDMPVSRYKELPSYKQVSIEQLSLLNNLPLETVPQRSITERSRASLEMFSELSHELAYQMSLRDLLRRILELTLKRLHANSGTIVVINERGKPIDGAVAYGGDIVSKVPQEYEQIVQRGLAGWVLHNRKAALISNTRDDPRWLPRPWDEESGRDRSAICVPLMQEDRAVGVLTLVASQAGVFSEEDLSLLAAVAMFITLVNYAL